MIGSEIGRIELRGGGQAWVRLSAIDAVVYDPENSVDSRYYLMGPTIYFCITEDEFNKFERLIAPGLDT